MSVGPDTAYPGLPDTGQPAGTPATGNDVVDGALADLSGVAQLPPAEQIAAFEDVHQRLSATLHGVDDD